MEEEGGRCPGDDSVMMLLLLQIFPPLLPSFCPIVFPPCSASLSPNMNTQHFRVTLCFLLFLLIFPRSLCTHSASPALRGWCALGDHRRCSGGGRGSDSSGSGGAVGAVDGFLAVGAQQAGVSCS